ncbi:MAG: hypothetical protein AAGF12_31590 [Myxococcota bacterium]
MTSPFTDEHAAVFEDGVDFVDDPTLLEGPWRDSWSDELDQRVQLSDTILLVDIETIRTDVDLDQMNTYRLILAVNSSLFGQPPAEQLTLTVAQGERGYGTVDGNESRLLDGDFIAFLKFMESDEGEIVPRWHLSPATDGVVRRTEYLIERRRAERRSGRTTEVVHAAE